MQQAGNGFFESRPACFSFNPNHFFIMKISNLVPLLLASFCWLNTAKATTYTVTTTAASGANSLAQAILNANANPGPDLITFNILPAGPQSIVVTSTLVITDDVTIDGSTQPNWTANPIIKIGELYGSIPLLVNTGTANATFKYLDLSRTGTAAGTGLTFESSGNLTVQNCWAKNRVQALEIVGAANVTVTGCDFTDSGAKYAYALRFQSISGTMTVNSNVLGGKMIRGFSMNYISNKTIGGTTGDIQMGTGLKNTKYPFVIQDCSNIAITGLDLAKPGTAAPWGAIVENSALVSVTNCIVTNRNNGININYCSDVTVSGNNLNNTGVALTLNTITGIVNVHSNTIGGGLYLAATPNRTIGATTGDIRLGTGLLNFNITVDYSANTTITGLNLLKNGAQGGWAIVVNHSPNFTATGNKMVNFQVGMVIQGEGNTVAATVTCNNFQLNNVGLWFQGTGSGTRTANNNAFVNNFNALINETNPIQPVDATNNWWGTPSGPGNLTNNVVGANVTTAPVLGAAPGCVNVTDLDNDGYAAPADCNDLNSAIHPGALETCGNGVDENCDGFDAVTFNASSVVVRPDCNGDFGQVTISCTGTPQNFDFVWTSGSATVLDVPAPQTFNLLAGTHTVTVTNDCNLSRVRTVTVTQPAPLTLSVVSVVPWTGGLKKVKLGSTGGTAPKQFNVDGGTYQASVYFYLPPGLYEFGVKDLNDCTELLDATISLAPPPSDDRANATETDLGKIAVWPNPNAGRFSVQLPEAAVGENLFLKICDLAGRTVFEKQAENGSQRQTIQAERLAPGLYFLQVISEGKLLAVEKFVKE